MHAPRLVALAMMAFVSACLPGTAVLCHEARAPQPEPASGATAVRHLTERALRRNQALAPVENWFGVCLSAKTGAQPLLYWSNDGAQTARQVQTLASHKAAARSSQLSVNLGMARERLLRLIINPPAAP